MQEQKRERFDLFETKKKLYEKQTKYEKLNFFELKRKLYKKKNIILQFEEEWENKRHDKSVVGGSFSHPKPCPQNIIQTTNSTCPFGEAFRIKKDEISLIRELIERKINSDIGEDRYSLTSFDEKLQKMSTCSLYEIIKSCNREITKRGEKDSISILKEWVDKEPNIRSYKFLVNNVGPFKRVILIVKNNKDQITKQGNIRPELNQRGATKEQTKEISKRNKEKITDLKKQLSSQILQELENK